MNTSEDYLVPAGNARSTFAAGVADCLLVDQALCSETRAAERWSHPGIRACSWHANPNRVGIDSSCCVYHSGLSLVAALSSGASLLAVLIPLAVLVAMVLAIPHSVILDDGGIRQRRWLITDRQTPWAEIATVARGRNTGRIFVWSKTGGLAVVFSPLLVGQGRFEHEIRARAKDVVLED